MNIYAIIFFNKNTLEGNMAYKKIDNYFSFADIAIQNNADKNRSLIFLNQINATIDWEPVQDMLMKVYEIG